MNIQDIVCELEKLARSTDKVFALVEVEKYQRFQNWKTRAAELEKGLNAAFTHTPLRFTCQVSVDIRSAEESE